MTTIITVAQRKGGVGKTTIAVSIAAEFVHRGHDIALLDADSQRSACQWAEPGNLEFPVYEMALGEDPISLWAKEVRKIKAAVAVIDTAPNEREMAAAIAMADVILVPCTASGLDIEATANTLAIISAARKQRRQNVRVVLIPNRVDRRTLEGRQLVEELREFGETVSPAIANRSAFVRSFSTGQSVATFAPGEPADLEIRAVADIVERHIPHGK